MLGAAISHLEHRGITVLLSRLAEPQREMIGSLTPAADLGPGRSFASTPEAIAEARRLVLGAAAVQPRAVA